MELPRREMGRLEPDVISVGDWQQQGLLDQDDVQSREQGHGFGD
jgi:hypothetical protein